MTDQERQEEVDAGLATAAEERERVRVAMRMSELYAARSTRDEQLQAAKEMPLDAVSSHVIDALRKQDASDVISGPAQDYTPWHDHSEEHRVAYESFRDAARAMREHERRGAELQLAYREALLRLNQVVAP